MRQSRPSGVRRLGSNRNKGLGFARGETVASRSY